MLILFDEVRDLFGYHSRKVKKQLANNKDA